MERRGSAAPRRCHTIPYSGDGGETDGSTPLLHITQTTVNRSPHTVTSLNNPTQMKVKTKIGTMTVHPTWIGGV